MLLIIGCNDPGHMGRYLARAAASLHVDHELMDVAGAETGNRVLQRIYWRFRGRRPVYLQRFASGVLETCQRLKPQIVLTTGGRVPLDRPHIETLKKTGIKIVNYSTDDPWNPGLLAPWFIATLPAYDAVFTPRRCNIGDFKRCGVVNIQYLPFGHDPQSHQPLGPDSTSPPADGSSRPSDVLFVGGCDADRLPLIGALIDAGVAPALFGGYWNQHLKTRPFARGIVSQEAIRAASAATAINLCLVRRANRDDHVMRSFEAAAIGGCIVAEDTVDHRELFGPDNVAVRYFTTETELQSTVKDLLRNRATRHSMSVALAERMAQRSDTYADRLKTILNAVEFRVEAHAGMS